jgi:hypothetical protein
VSQGVHQVVVVAVGEGQELAGQVAKIAESLSSETASFFAAIGTLSPSDVLAQANIAGVQWA